MKLNDLLTENISPSQLANLEKILDDLFAEVGIDIELDGNHFLERINDPRNGEDITIPELKSMFFDAFKKHGKKLATHKTGYEGVIFDINSKINVPFLLKWNKQKKELDLVAKTAMRKANFQSRTKKFKVGS